MTETQRTLNATPARQGSRGRHALWILIASTALIIIAMLVLFVFSGSNEVPDGIGVVDANGGVAETQEQPTADIAAEPMEVPTSAQ